MSQNNWDLTQTYRLTDVHGSVGLLYFKHITKNFFQAVFHYEHNNETRILKYSDCQDILNFAKKSKIIIETIENVYQ